MQGDQKSYLVQTSNPLISKAEINYILKDKWQHYMKQQPVEKLEDQLVEIHTKDWWKAHGLKNHFAPTETMLVLIQAQYIAIAYSQGNKGMKYMPAHPKMKEYYRKIFVIMQYKVDYVIKICLCLLQNLGCLIWKANTMNIMLSRWIIKCKTSILHCWQFWLKKAGKALSLMQKRQLCHLLLFSSFHVLTILFRIPYRSHCIWLLMNTSQFCLL